MTLRHLTLLLPLLTAGCPWISPADHEARLRDLPDDTAEDAPVDADGDGYRVDEDCDDTDPTVHPGAEERCNEVDDDCDGQVDDADDGVTGTSTWWHDADGDGFGVSSDRFESCAAPSDYVDSAGGEDCDDTDLEIHPGADEHCDGADEDCDGETDEGAVDAPTWYTDADADGYGDPGDADAACGQPTGTVADATDCDDGDAAIHPGATEVCDSADNDCDGDTDEPDATDAATWYADTDSDGYGDPAATTPACTQPSGYVAGPTDGVAFDCDDGDTAINPAATEVCNEVDDDCSGVVDDPYAVDATDWYADADADGYGDASSTTVACTAPSGFIADATDCDDTDAAINPAATEVCNEVDDDCDGTVDGASAADATDWYTDADADGYGDPTTLERSCLAGSGHVTDSTDCDDTDASVYPGAAEVCDGRDGDCDGFVDAPTPPDAPLWYADTDGDGFGDASVTDLACTAASGFVGDDTDCDDTDAGVNPDGAETWYDGLDADCDGADDYDQDGDGDPSDAWGGGDCDDTLPTVYSGAPEIGLDGLDNDCSGADSIERDLADAAASLTGGTGGDMAGWSLAAGGDLDGDGGDDLLIGAPGASSDAGAVYLFDGSSAAGALAPTDAAVTLSGTGTHDAGWSVAAGDVDGDGWNDLLVGAPGVSSDAGAAYLIFGPVSASTDLSTAATATWTGQSGGDRAGAFVSLGGDFDADGYQELLVGMPYDYNGYDEDGRAFVVSGRLTGTSDLVSLATVTYRMRNTEAHTGAAMASGDFNGDGTLDLVVGAPGGSVGGNYLGVALLQYGPLTSGEWDLSNSDDYDARFFGASSRSQNGWAVANLGDTDGDGYEDLAIGAPLDDAGGANAGQVYVLLGSPPDGRCVDHADAIFTGGAGDEAGTTVAGPGDLDGDGDADLVVGAPHDTVLASEGGAAYILLAPFSGSYDAASADGHLLGTGADDLAGMAVAGAGDIDADGVTDLLMGAPEHDGTTSHGAGRAYLLTGLVF